MRIEFEWDEKKNAANKQKQGIPQEEATTCFEDEHARVFFDEEHSAMEDRSILIGLAVTLNTLVVVFTERRKKDEETIVNRIISARRATKKELKYYWDERRGDCL